MISVLVTGANGQLGRTLAGLFFENDDAIEFTFVSKSELDISNKDEVQAIFNKNNYKYCINCAAYTNVEQAEQTPLIAFKINAEGAKNLAQSCKNNNTVLIHVSTDYVFDGEKTTPYTVDDIPNPINEYGKSKLLGEQYVQKGLNNYFIIRTSWLYSGEFGHNFYQTIVRKIKEKAKLEIITSQTGTPTNCIELSSFIYFLIKTEQSSYGMYHYSALGEATWYDFAMQISRYLNHSSTYPIDEFNLKISKTKRPKYSVLDNRKAQLLNVTVKRWQESLNEVLSAYKEI